MWFHSYFDEICIVFAIGIELIDVRYRAVLDSKKES